MVLALILHPPHIPHIHSARSPQGQSAPVCPKTSEIPNEDYMYKLHSAPTCKDLQAAFKSP
eukprot:1157799-Pelagomonas_calceolata.AAC.9